MNLAVKLKLPPTRRGTVRPLWETVLAMVAIVFTFVLLILGITFSYYSAKYKQVVDERLKGPVFTQTPRIYAAPREVRTGQKLTSDAIAMQLRSAGYSAPGRHESRMGTYEERGETIVVHPGA